MLAAASQGSEPQQLIQEAKGDFDGGEGPRWRGEEREKARMGMVVAAAQRTNREVWPVAARCSRSCVGASQKGSSAPCVLRQAANVARKSKLIKEGQEKGYQLARTFGFLSLRL